MARKHKPEEIIGKLREAEIVLAQGGTVLDACRRIGVTEQSYYRWRKEFGGHRYKATRNCIRPEPEPATEAVREYSPKHPPVAPRGYILVEARTTKYGYQYYKYVYNPKEERKRFGSRLN